MMNLNDVLKLKYPDADFTKDIKLCDHGLGNGIEIQEWNLEDPMPTKEDLEKWSEEFDLQYRQNLARQKRKYPPISDQLDMLYHDAKDKTSVWLDTIEAIKLAHPIPKE